MIQSREPFSDPIGEARYRQLEFAKLCWLILRKWFPHISSIGDAYGPINWKWYYRFRFTARCVGSYKLWKWAWHMTKNHKALWHNMAQQEIERYIKGFEEVLRRGRSDEFDVQDFEHLMGETVTEEALRQHLNQNYERLLSYKKR